MPDSAPSLDRHLPLEGVHNFRDFGDYAVAGGGRVKPGLLWRSAQHRDATDADLAQISGLNIAHIIDLRGDSERAEHPCRRAPDFNAKVHFAPGETTGTAPHLAALEGALTVQAAKDTLNKSYVTMPWREQLVETYKLYFNALETGEASLIHCFAGKDRTGFAVALVQRLLGVHADDVMDDYLLTNQVGNIDQRVAAGAGFIRSRFGEKASDDAIRAMMMVDAVYLDTAFKAVAERHASIEDYAADVLGVDAPRVDRLKALYIAG